jgi:hypothetical protein
MFGTLSEHQAPKLLLSQIFDHGGIVHLTEVL